MTSEAAALARLAAERSQTYWFLAELFLTLPDAALLGRLREQLAVADRAGPDAPLSAELRALAAAVARADPERLGIEFTRIFGGLAESYGPPPPFESMHRSGGSAAGDGGVPAPEQSYLEAGFPSIAVTAVPQDHLGAELRFVALLAMRESEAWNESRPADARTDLARGLAFLDRNLLAWVPSYCERVAREADEPYFAAIAALTAAALALDRANLEELARATAPA